MVATIWAAGSRSGTTVSTPSGTTGVNSSSPLSSASRRASAAGADAMPRNTFTLRPSRVTATPGLSGVPASIPPSMTLSAPPAMAFATSPG